LTSPGQEEYYISREKEMIKGSHKPADGAGKEHEVAAPQEREIHGDSCRCKEASTMSPRELLKLMIGDLTFWKKMNKK
jgi:hypothetical protein